MKQYNQPRGCWLCRQFRNSEKQSYVLHAASELILQKSIYWATNYEIKVLISPQDEKEEDMGERENILLS